MCEQENKARPRYAELVTETVVSLAAGVIAGILTHLLIYLFQHINLHRPELLVALALLIVIPLIVYFAVRTKRRRLFWLISLGILAAIVIYMLWSTVEVPNVVGMSLTDAKAAVANKGLVFEEHEMVKGGSDKVVLQRPEAGRQRFRGSPVKLFFGQRPTVSITEPADGGVIGSHREYVRGSSTGVGGSTAFYIRVLVRPRDNHVWVQDPPEVGSDGRFSVLAYFGTPELGRGEDFRVLAIVTPEPLKPGDYGLEIAKFVASSPVITVKRER